MAERVKRGERKKSLLLQWIELGMFRAIQIPLRILPRSFVRSFGAAIGRIGFRLVRPRTRLALENVARTFPEISESERERIVATCWKQFCSETLTYIRTIEAPPDEVSSDAEVVGEHHLRQALEERRGLILYTAHFGAWEAAIAMVRRVGIPFAVVARPLDNELLETLLKRSRKRFDVEMVPKRNAARTLVNRLGQGEGVLVLPDQAVNPREGILVPFLGRPAWTTTAPARLALRFGAPMLGAFCYRREGKVVAELSPPILTRGLEESHENVEQLTRRINDDISERIRQSPESWLWMHDRWKHVDSRPSR